MRNFALYAITVLIWGTTWFAIEFQLGVVPAEVSIVWRYALAASLMFLWCGWRGLPLRYGWRDHLVFAGFGALLFGFNYIGAYLAQHYIPSALNAVCFTSVVWLNILNARLFLRTPIETTVVAGAGLGVVGIICLFWPSLRTLSLGEGTLIGALLALAGSLAASLGNVLAQRAQTRGLRVEPANAWGMLYGTLIVAAIAALQGKPFIFDWSQPYILSLLYLAVFGSVIGFWCYLTLIGEIGAHRAGFVVVLFPVVAVLISVAFEGLAVDRYLLGGVTLVLFGNTVTLWHAFRRRTRATA
ncbi:MAG: EamA family transporter [Pseudomonadota bacterium]